MEENNQEFEDKELFLCFVKFVGKETGGENRYEFIFSENPDVFWGENFEYKPCGLCNELIPDVKYVDKTVVVRTMITFDLVTDSNCFSFQDCADGIVALAWENIDDYEAYPDEGRIVLDFGESYEPGTNDCGFNSLPAGGWLLDGTLFGGNFCSRYWTSTAKSLLFSYSCALRATELIFGTNSPKMTIRCIRN